MTLYDEAGLTRRATAEEIRQVYHNFVRLLHPDTVREPALQALAEVQLRRINAVFEVLNDPKRRAEYDQSLNLSLTSTDLRVLGLQRALPGPLHAWVALLIPLFVVAWWVTLEGPGRAGPKLGEQGYEERPDISIRNTTAVPVLPSSATRAMRKLRSESAGAQIASGSAQAEPARDAVATYESTEFFNPEVSGQTGRPEAPEEKEGAGRPPDQPVMSKLAPLALPAKPALQIPSAGQPPNSSGLAGIWLYAQRPSGTARQNWYPPEFIELKIHPSADGVIRGSYHARYRIGNLPISPEVQFRFQGSGDSMPWASANGAQGEIRLRQTSPLTMLVDWNATQPGDVPSLTSGSALLFKSPQ